MSPNTFLSMFLKSVNCAQSYSFITKHPYSRNIRVANGVKNCSIGKASFVVRAAMCYLLRNNSCDPRHPRAKCLVSK